MKKVLWIIVALWLAGGIGQAGERDSLLVMFWNVENFFDTEDSGGGKSDAEFTPGGARRWSKKRFYAKCSAIAKTVFAAADRFGRLPDAIGLAEVENVGVLRALVGTTLLRKAGYRIVHFDSPDPRGIDCALLYRDARLPLASASACHLFAPDGSVMRTRDILLFQSDSIDILVNHHPSKLGKGSGSRRAAAMARMKSLCDSLSATGRPCQLCIGDFNDDVWGGEKKGGTIKFNGSWERIDGSFVFGRISVRETVFSPEILTEKDRAFGGTKPRRTYIGPSYNGGVSDHYPVVCEISFGK